MHDEDCHCHSYLYYPSIWVRYSLSYYGWIFKLWSSFNLVQALECTPVQKIMVNLGPNRWQDVQPKLPDLLLQSLCIHQLLWCISYCWDWCTLSHPSWLLSCRCYYNLHGRAVWYELLQEFDLLDRSLSCSISYPYWFWYWIRCLHHTYRCLLN